MKQGTVQRKIGEGVPSGAIGVGDVVRVTKKDNTVFEGRILQVDSRQLVLDVGGKDQPVWLSEVRRIEPLAMGA